MLIKEQIGNVSTSLDAKYSDVSWIDSDYNTLQNEIIRIDKDHKNDYLVTPSKSSAGFFPISVYSALLIGPITD